MATVLPLALCAVVAAGCSSADQETPTPPGAGPSAETSADPAAGIDGVVRVEYGQATHVDAEHRVAYTHSPPLGGTHDAVWAGCDGVVYPRAVRNENMVHSLEHGAVWIAYSPDRITGADLDALAGRVSGQPYLMLSPYPGLDRPISLQSWGYQLKVDSAGDKRIDEFIRALRSNSVTTPEPNAPCAAPDGFDVSNPPPFEPAPPGPDAAPEGAGASGG